MTVFDYICFVIIGAAVMLCAFKGLRKIIFRLAAFIVSMIVARLIGDKIGNLLLSDVIQIDIGPISEKIKSTIISSLGTLVVFILLFIFLKLIFKVVEGKFDQNINSVIIDRLCGALVGFFLGVAIVFVFTEVVDIVITIIATFKKDGEIFDFVQKSIVFRLLRNLN